MSLGNILRLPCKTYGNFSVEKQGFMLAGHVLASLEVSTVDLCEQHCLYHPNCSSINWKTPTSGSANCQINEKSTEDLYFDLKLSPSSEWTYKTTNYKERHVSYFLSFLCYTTKGEIKHLLSIFPLFMKPHYNYTLLVRKNSSSSTGNIKCTSIHLLRVSTIIVTL